MRTRKARKLLRRGLLIAKVRGHKPQLISHSGALKLYGCLNKNCSTTLEAWDSPDNVAGPMLHSYCNTPNMFWLRKFIIKLIAL